MKIALYVVKIIDILAMFLLGFYAFAFVAPLSGLYVDNTYDEDLVVAGLTTNRFNLLLFFMVILYLFARKFPKLKYVEMLLWAVLFVAVPYMLHQIPSVKQPYNNVTVTEDLNHE